MRFSDYLNELHLKQQGLDTFVLPTNINKDSDVDEIIQCLNFFIKENKYIFSKNRIDNFNFIKQVNIKINPNFNNIYDAGKTSFIIKEICDNLECKDFKDAHLDANKESIAFTFVIKNIAKRCKNLLFLQNKSVYFKFAFSYYKDKIKNNVYGKKTVITHSMLPKNNHVYVMPRHSFLDIISLHYSRI